jgi:hypothetical protein
MAARNPILPGLSRSAACRTKSCGRLLGHKGEHRGTLNRAAASLPVGPAIVLDKTLSVAGKTWHIVVFADGTTTSTEVVESPAPKVPARTSTRRTKSRTPKVGQCRISRNGVRCSRPFGHKQAGKRHSFAVVTIVPEVVAERTQIIRGKSSRRRGYVVSSKPSARLA